MTLRPTTRAEEYVLDNPQMRRFITAVNEIRARESDPQTIVTAIRPHFADLLVDQAWLPARYQELSEESRMGRGIGMWLLYRAGDRGLAFSALVVPPGVQTPVHNHLAWGLVGLYRGQQEEEVFTRRDDGSRAGYAELEVTERHALKAGQFYELMPENDIHRVRTTSSVNSVSLHLLGNDNGCIWRDRFHPEEHRVESFRSGYVNVPCLEDESKGTD
ncbi:MAG: cysteine dioxygenase family protein [Chloroflexi bacterium]|nr:cysteine dioxygenase family protein [Chloroflexota bacterium]